MSRHRKGLKETCITCWRPWPCPSTEPACPHGMPTPSSCIDCMDEGNIAPPSRPPAPTVVAVLTARFPGDCPTCNLPIHAGQRITSWTDDRYRHEDCTP